MKILVNEFIEEHPRPERITVAQIVKAVAPRAASAVPDDCRESLAKQAINIAISDLQCRRKI